MFRCMRKITLRAVSHGVLVLVSVLALSGPVSAQDGLKIELNKLEPVEDACRAYVIFENHSESAFESLKLDLVMFNADGVINKRLAVEGAPLPQGKTSVKLFDIKDVDCEQISKILLNDVLSCNGPDGELGDCLTGIETVSRGSASFFK